MTAHNSANKEQIASTVIMPGDPLRSQMIAEKFLEDCTLVNNVRGVQGYTGFYKGKKVTVMASGMGNPSMGIYSYELYKFYDVKNIIRVGTIGGLKEDLQLKSVIITNQTYSKTNYNNFYEKTGGGFVSGSQKLISLAQEKAKELHMQFTTGNTLNSDTFYTDEDEKKLATDKGLLGVEMECASLYINAQRLQKDALTICTVSNNLITGEETSSDERQNAFLDMIKLALEMAITDTINN